MNYICIYLIFNSYSISNLLLHPVTEDFYVKVELSCEESIILGEKLVVEYKYFYDIIIAINI